MTRRSPLGGPLLPSHAALSGRRRRRRRRRAIGCEAEREPPALQVHREDDEIEQLTHKGSVQADAIARAADQTLRSGASLAGAVLMSTLLNTTFSGASGSVSFDENGDLFGGKNPAGLSFSWHDERLASTIAKAWLSLPVEVRQKGWSEFKHKFNTSGVGGENSIEDRTFLKTR